MGSAGSPHSEDVVTESDVDHDQLPHPPGKSGPYRFLQFEGEPPTYFAVGTTFLVRGGENIDLPPMDGKPYWVKEEGQEPRLIGAR